MRTRFIIWAQYPNGVRSKPLVWGDNEDDAIKQYLSDTKIRLEKEMRLRGYDATNALPKILKIVNTNETETKRAMAVYKSQPSISADI